MPVTGIHNPKLLYPELSHLIIGAAFDVHNGLGPGWNEWDYHRAMLDALHKNNVQAESHLREQVIHRGNPVDQFELDILVNNQIILELKHISTDFSCGHYAQIINYLKRWESAYLGNRIHRHHGNRHGSIEKRDETALHPLWGIGEFREITTNPPGH